MLTKNDIRFIKDLHQKKNRESSGLFICEGEKLVEELAQSDWEIHSIYATVEANAALKSKFPQIQEISVKDLERISLLQTPNQFLALVKQKKASVDSIDFNCPLTLVLDKINDPGNLGTIIRTADWFGIKQLICNSQTVDLYNPKTIQSAMGSVFHTSVVYADLNQVLPELKQNKFQIIAAEMKGENVLTYAFPTKTALLMGSESHGIADDLKQWIDTSVTIPKFGQAESLNVAVATAIILSHFKS